MNDTRYRNGKIEQQGDVCILPLYDGYGDRYNYLFDAEFRLFVEGHSHYFNGRFLQVSVPSSKGKTVSLHNHVMKVSNNQCVAFINGDIYDARRCNLEVRQKGKWRKNIPRYFDGEGNVSSVSKIVQDGHEYWKAQFVEHGHKKARQFRIDKHGDFEACRLACELRVLWMQEAGYFMDEPCLDEHRAVEYYDEDSREREVVPFYGEPSLVV